ncbi:DUF3817 domain-containing protein [Agromyces seonyuensis]|uniref:DUF3817 domain-containing protein n=1 Tax=Agromyces seonyuensis TaxID=2662446 RepID=A0A6I4P229_9MICO|nr:DUF3817 domain-containing protein [Agromyces seonyuensis]
MSPKRLFRIAAIAEAVTWALLLSAMVAKYGFGQDWAVSIAGGVHGFVFLAFIAVSVLVGVNQRWSVGRIALSVAMAIPPFATVPFEIAQIKRGRLEGDWRREPGEEPDRLVDQVLRTLLARPLVTGILAIALVAAVFAALLVVGPPGGGEA